MLLLPTVFGDTPTLNRAGLNGAGEVLSRQEQPRRHRPRAGVALRRCLRYTSDATKAMTTRNRQHAALLTARHDSRVSHRAAGDFTFEHRLSRLEWQETDSNAFLTLEA